MKFISVKLPDELAERLHGEASRRGITPSELSREAIEVHLARGGRRFLAAQAGRSGQAMTSERVEEILRSGTGRPHDS